MKNKHTMKRTLLILSISIYGIANAQAPNWLWAKSAGGIYDDEGKSITTDASGNVYVTGCFYSSSITFGTITLYNANAGNKDFFAVRYDAVGNVLWAESAGGINDDTGYGITTDASGNVYVTGKFRNSSITFGTTILNNAGVDDIFIVKYDSFGSLLWAKSAGGFDDDIGFSITTDAIENVYITGCFYSSSITLGATTLNNANAGFPDIFVVKYDAAGNVLWAKSEGGTNYDVGYGITTDAIGNVYVTGSFFNSSIIIDTTTLYNAGYWDIFVVKYDTAGKVLWAKSAGGNDFDWTNSITSDANGNVYVTGYFRSPFITFDTTTLNNVGYENIFVVKYDTAGNVLWAKSAGGTDYIEGNSITSDANSSMYVAGYFASASVTFGTTTLNNANAGSTDIFVVKYDAAGNVLWAKSAGGTDYDNGYSITADASGNVYITGSFYSPSVTFGTTTLNNVLAGYSDMFIVKLAGSTGIEENNLENMVTVFPNPASGIFQVKSQKSKVKSLEIYNVYGEKIIEVLSNRVIELNSAIQQFNNSTIDISSHPSGIYFLQIITEEGIAVKKIIVSR